MMVTPFPIFILVKPDALKAEMSILVTLSGIVTLVRAEQSRNAAPAIVFVPDFIV